MAKSKKKQQKSILNDIKKHGNISRAARSHDVNRRTINRWKENDPVFRRALKTALEIGRE